MKLFILLFMIASSRGLKWKELDAFKDMFQEYRQSALQTISTIENVINNSRTDSTAFLQKIYSDNSFLGGVSEKKRADDVCYEKLHKNNNMVLSFKIQGFVLETPLQIRTIDIRQRINNMNIAIDTYQTLADQRFSSCQFFNKTCTDEANQWLESTIYSLSCDLQPNCNSHSIRKRSYCPFGEYRCNKYDGNCISGHYFCDGSCNCNGCGDEPSGCVRDCSGFRCTETFRCISNIDKCDGNDDCGDGSDEENCPPPTTTTPSAFYHGNCSIETGDFLCSPKKCIKVEQVCDGYNDCEDGSDEGELCKDRQCTPECSKKGGICMKGPKGPQCLYECPPGTFETSTGCSLQPEAPPATLALAIDDTPRLISRYSVRFNYLKTKTMMEISKSMMEFVRCKKEEFKSLSKIIRFPSEFHQYNAPSTNQPVAPTKAAHSPTSMHIHQINPLGTEETTTTTDSLDDYLV